MYCCLGWIARWLAFVLATLVPVADLLAAQQVFLRIEATHHTALVRRIAVSPDDALVATVGDDKTGRIWRASDRRLLATLRLPIGDGDTGRLYGAAFSPDGQELAVAGTTGDLPGGHRISIFGAGHGNLLRTLPLDAGNVVRLLWTHSGNHLVACLSGNHGVRILSRDGHQVLSEDFSAPCYGLAELADGSILASGYDGLIRHYRPQPGRWQAANTIRTEGKDPRSIAVSPDGRYFAVGYASRLPSGSVAVDVFDVASLTLARRLSFTDLASDQAGLGSVAWSGDGRVIAAAGRATGNPGYKPRMILKRVTWPQGSVQSDFIATDTVQDLASRGRHDFAVAANGTWALVPAEGPISPLGASVLDMRGPDGLAVDATADTVSFAAQAWSGPHQFSLRKRELLPGVAEGTTGPQRFSFGLTLSQWQDRLQPVIAGRPVPMEAGEISRAAAVLPDASAVVLGTSRTLRRFDRQGDTVWSIRTPSEVTAVHTSRDGRVVVSTQMDGTVRWWRATDGLSLLNLYASIDGQWVLWTEEGYYDTAPGAERLFGWHVNSDDGRSADFHAAGAFRDTYHRPDVIDRVLDTLDPRQALTLADQRRRVQTPDGAVTAAVPATVPQPPPRRLPPVLSVFTQRALQTEARELRLDFALRAGDQPVDAIVARIDGRAADLTELQMPARQDGQAIGHVMLRVRESSAEVMLLAKAGEQYSEPVFVAWSRRPEQPPTPPVLGRLPAAPAPASMGTVAPLSLSPALYGLTLPAPSPVPVLSAPSVAPNVLIRPIRRTQKLFLVAIGVSEYADKGNSLEFPAKDAGDFARLMAAQSGRMYARVESRVLTDRDARRPAVLDALHWLRRSVGPEDTAMLFIAGHGLNDGQGRYRFLTHEADVARLDQTSISEGELRSALAALPGRAMLFVDTCHAGNALGSSLALSKEISRLANSLSATENGVIVFSASTGRQEAVETAKWGNGAFTRALLQGLQGAADFRKDGVVTHQGLSYFLSREVKELTSGRQTPVTAIPMGMIDFPLVAL
ncbi:MAG: caspase family protein [Rubrivivax sp.]|nr:caspase family protein [Rubrivivax sp.]